jgi:hypothetical protein
MREVTTRSRRAADARATADARAWRSRDRGFGGVRVVHDAYSGRSESHAHGTLARKCEIHDRPVTWPRVDAATGRRGASGRRRRRHTTTRARHRARARSRRRAIVARASSTARRGRRRDDDARGAAALETA